MKLKKETTQTVHFYFTDRSKFNVEVRLIFVRNRTNVH